MSDNNNESIDKLADAYNENDGDRQAYIKAQSSTIIAQTKEINILRKQKEQLEKEMEKFQMENIQLKALNPGGTSDLTTSDEETICVVQLAILKSLAMNRELTLEECKKTEIFCKVLKDIRNKVTKKDEPTASNLSDADLLKAMNEMMKGDPQ